MEEQQKAGHGFMVKLATFIVDKRSLFFLIVIVALIFSAFSRNWVEVENDLIAFLPVDAETKLALDVRHGGGHGRQRHLGGGGAAER